MIDPSKLASVLRTLRAHGVTTATLEGVGSFTFGAMPVAKTRARKAKGAPAGAPPADDDAPMREMGILDLEKMRYAHTEGMDD